MNDYAFAILAVVVSFAIIFGGILWLWVWSGKPRNAAQWTCTRCGITDEPSYYDAGSTIVLLLLLLLGFIPGLIYWLWRRSASYCGCAHCGSRELVPEDSPRARQISAG